MSAHSSKTSPKKGERPGNFTQEEDDAFQKTKSSETGDERGFLSPIVQRSVFENSSPTSVHEFSNNPNGPARRKIILSKVPDHLMMPVLGASTQRETIDSILPEYLMMPNLDECSDSILAMEVDGINLQQKPSLSNQTILVTSDDTGAAYPFFFPDDVRKKLQPNFK